jgi:IS30 family transposase
MTLIDDRPIEVLERLVPGHWEGDLIKGKRNQSQVGTLVERTTLYVALVRLENGNAETAAEGFAEILNRFDAAMRLSMTYDQGREMARHQELSAHTGLKVYFAHPHSPWERGRNENTNGLLRQYLPKGEDLSGYSQQQLDDIAASLNARPRKSLGWKAPNSFCQREPSTSKNTGQQQTQSTVLHLELESAHHQEHDAASLPGQWRGSAADRPAGDGAP